SVLFLLSFFFSSRRRHTRSKRDWSSDVCSSDLCHVDGFRFDLAAVMGRTPEFRQDAPLFTAIQNCPVLSQVKLIAEPWDIAPGGYQVGNFPPLFAEWNDQDRKSVV